MIIAAEKMSNEQRYEFISKFGIGQDNGLGLPGEADGLLYSADQWDLRTQNTVLFGQAYTTNALQLTNAVAVIANKGVKSRSASSRRSAMPKGIPKSRSLKAKRRA